MNISLVMIGIVFLAAAAIRGGLKASGYEIKPITSVGGRLGLGMVGGLALILGILASSVGTTKPEMPVTAPTNEPSQDGSASATPRITAAPLPTLPPASVASPLKPSVFWNGQIVLDEYASSDRPNSATSTVHRLRPVETMGTLVQETSRASPLSTPTVTCVPNRKGA